MGKLPLTVVIVYSGFFRSYFWAKTLRLYTPWDYYIALVTDNAIYELLSILINTHSCNFFWFYDSIRFLSDVESVPTITLLAQISQIQPKLTVSVWPNFSERTIFWNSPHFDGFANVDSNSKHWIALSRLTSWEKCGGRFSLALFCLFVLDTPAWFYIDF